MRKFVSIFVLFVFASVLSCYGNGINWAAYNNYVYYDGGSVMLNGDLDSGLGCFAQLLWVGPNGVIDAAYNTGDGTGVGLSDDVVVDKWYVGFGVFGNDGYFSGATVSEGGNIVSNRVYFGRVWSAPALDYGTGTIPTSLTNNYANSGLYTYHSVLPTGDDFDMTETVGLSTTLTPLSVIPEPAMFGLAVIGLLSLRLSTRKSKKA